MQNNGEGQLSRLFTIIFILAAVAAVLPAQEAVSVRDLYAQGKKQQDAENFFTAIELYKTALETSPAYVDPIIGLAESYFSLGEYEEALKWSQLGEKYARTDLHLKTLQGRIYIGLADYDKAKNMFDQVLQAEPYNFDAQFGKAELDIALGRTIQAKDWYEKALNLSPQNRRALLSLALVFDSGNQQNQAEILIKMALHYYPSNAMVQYIAGRHYMKKGDLNRAEMHAKKALALKKNFPEAALLLSTIYLRENQYSKIVAILEELLKTDRNNYRLWYTLGTAYRELGNIESGIHAFSQAFRIRPDDEISRMALEDMIIEKLPMDDPQRINYAGYHFQNGRDYQHRNEFSKAVTEYRRGLKLAPFSKEGRLFYADIYKALGYFGKYLAELRVIDEDNTADTKIKDEIEIYSSLLGDPVAEKWGLRQYPEPLSKQKQQGNGTAKKLLDRSNIPYNFLLYYDQKGSSLEHPQSESILTSYFYDLLMHQSKTNVVGNPLEFSDFSDAFRRARTRECDYFAVVQYHGTERVFHAECTIYSAATGGKLQHFSVIRTGNGKVVNTLSKLADYIQNELPLRGRLVDRKFDAGIANFGSMDGIKKDVAFHIIRSGKVDVDTQKLGIVFRPEDVLGTFTVTALDEQVCEGSIISNLFFNMINPGDELILKTAEESDTAKKTEEQQTAGGAAAVELYRNILKIK